jgi:type IV secretion system protein VirB10
MSRPETDVGVAGERSAPVVNTARSMQSRISSLLAAGLMILLGLGALSWYYANALGRQKRLRQAATTAATNVAQAEMALPPLGRLESSHVLKPVVLDVSTTGGALAPAGLAATIGATRDLPLEQAQPNWNAAGSFLPPYSRANSPPKQTTSDRRLSGVAFSRDSAPSNPAQPNSAATSDGNSLENGPAILSGGPMPPGDTRAGASLTALLRPSVTSPVRAQLLPTQQFLLPKGAFIDCTLETAIDSTLPGMTTCVTATDTFGVDGKVVLLERGSKLVGETRGEVQNGAARVFVLWTEARTPTGVLVPLDSPGTDELGRSGLPGQVNRHFWDRFGAAMLISVIDGAMQAAVQSSTHGGGAIIYNPSSAQDALTEVLKGTVHIAPTVSKHQGDRIQILVARDLDFRPVYELRTTGF